MSLFDEAALAARRNLVKKTLLNAECFVLKRALVDDGGGTEVETFTKVATPFKAQLQTIFERAQDQSAGGADMDFSDLKLVYDHAVELKQFDRLEIGRRTYTVRNVYDNISTALTNQAYVTVID